MDREDSDVIDTRRRGRALPILALVVVLLLLVGGYALSHRGHQSPSPAAGGTTPRPSSPAARPTPTASHPPSTAPSTPTSTPSTPTQTPTTATSSPTRSSAGTDAGLSQFVRSYFANVTSNRDVTWAELTPGMQAQAGGRSGYDQFWRTIAAVKVGSVQADAAGGAATARLTYVKQDGTTSTERHAFTFVRQGDSWLISSEHMA